MIHETHPLLAQTAGPLLPFLEDTTIQELRVNSDTRCFVVRSGAGKQRVAAVSGATLDTFLSVIADMVGAEWRGSSPRLHAAFPALGLRVQAARAPITNGPCATIRKHPQTVYPLEDFDAKGILTAVDVTRAARRLTSQGSIRQTLEYAVAQGYTVLMSGAVGSAKTTLLNALLHTFTEQDRRVVLLEDDPELRCAAADTQAFHTSLEPPISLRDLCKDVLRHSPDVLAVGEVRDGAALDMCKAFQCGTQGLGTIHAESADGTLLRLEQLIGEVSAMPQRQLIGEAVDVIVHMQQHGRSWKVTNMIAIDGYDGSQYLTRSLL